MAKNTIYLIHFDTALCHAQHYLGIAYDLDTRISEQRATTWDRADEPGMPGVKHGTGATLMGVVNSAGIAWTVVRTWRGDRSLERKLKRQHNGKRLCPICNPSQGATP